MPNLHLRMSVIPDVRCRAWAEVATCRGRCEGVCPASGYQIRVWKPPQVAAAFPRGLAYPFQLPASPHEALCRCWAFKARGSKWTLKRNAHILATMQELQNTQLPYPGI